METVFTISKMAEVQPFTSTGGVKPPTKASGTKSSRGGVIRATTSTSDDVEAATSTSGGKGGPGSSSQSVAQVKKPGKKPPKKRALKESVIEKTVVYEFTRVGVRLLQMSGLWFVWSGQKRIASSIFVVNCLLVLVSQIVSFVVNLDDVEAWMPKALLLIVYFFILSKAVFVVLLKKDIIDLHMAWQTDQNRGLRKYLRTCVVEVRIVCCLYVLALVLTGSVWVSRPTLVQKTDDYPEMPSGGWYPFNLRHPFLYFLAFSHQIVTVLMMGFTSHGCNLLSLTVAIFCGKLLKFHRKRLQLEVPEGRYIAAKIQEFSIAQEKIYNYVIFVNRVFSTVGLIHFFNVTAMFLIASFRASAPGVEWEESAVHMQGFYSQLVYLFFICRYGGEIIHECDEMKNAIYHWPWQNWRLSDMQLMQQLHAGCVNHVKLTAVGYVLTGEFFIRGIGIALSSFVLLHTLRTLV